MPYEAAGDTRRRIAVIGAGISGLSAAYALSETCRVTVFESGAKTGGHARTVLAGRRGDQPVDTGFIVFNHANYPRLSRLFDELGVPTAPSDMSFSASIRGGQFEYALRTLNSLVAQRRNLLRPKFYAMISDLLRFNARAEDLA
ncbi:MAG: FAD-dependent oxidoreductase, partial [Pseudomonadota bacterium]